MSGQPSPDGLFEVHTSRPSDRSVIAPERDVLTGVTGEFDRSDKGRDPHRARPHAGAPSLPRSPRPGAPPGRAPDQGVEVTRARPPGRSGWRIAPGVVAGVTTLVLLGVVAGGAAGLGWFRGPDAGPAGGGVVAGATAPARSGAASSPSAGAAAPTRPGATSSPSAGAASTSPTTSQTATAAALDPARIFGYEATFTYTKVEVSPKVTASAPMKVGDVQRTLWRCTAGTCKSPNGASFAAATPSYTFTKRTNIFPGSNSPCDPVTYTMTITRASDGSYAGTSSATPKSVSFEGRRGGIYTVCNSVKAAGTLRLQPVLKLEAGTAPDLAVPAVLDPVRVTGYVGASTSSPGGKKSPLTVKCDGGVCVVTCSPLCASAVIFPAAAATWSSADVALSQSCGGGSVSVELSRNPGGSYAGTVTPAVTVKAPRSPIRCPTSMAISLTPQTT